MPDTTATKRILILHSGALEEQGMIPLLREHFQVAVAATLDEALEAMRSDRFDAVLSETADFLPLERGIVSQQAAAVLDTVADGVCIVSADGQIVWANQRMRNCSKDVLDPLTECCREAFEGFRLAGPETDRARRFSLTPADGKGYFEVICSSVRDGAGVLRQVAAVVVDASMQRRQQQRLNAIERAGRELVGLESDPDSRRDAPQRLTLLEDRIIHYSRDVLHYQHFAVLVLDPRSNRLEMLISEGLSDETRGMELFASPEGNGVCGYVAATGHSYICPDVSRDGLYLPGMSDASSCLTVPLRMHDKVVGVLNIESDQQAAFGEEDRQFAEIFGNYVAMALNMLRLLITERHTTHTQVSGSISAELAGPLNDIITETGEIMEDYIGHDDLRRRLGNLIERAITARDTVRTWSESPEKTVLGAGAQGEAMTDPLLAGKHVLVADDEQLLRQTVRDVLTAAGCRVDLAADGAEAVAMLGERRYDLVISDIKMPGATGYEVFSAAKAGGAETAVVLITAFGYDPNHSLVKANQEGLSGVLMKPFKVQQLMDACHKALSA